MKNRRECQIYSKSDLLSAFESANTKIMTKFKESTSKICNQGINFLREMTFNYLKEQEKQPIIYPTFQVTNPHSTFQNQQSITRKSIFNNHHFPQKSPHRQLTFNQKEEAEYDEQTCQFNVKSEMKQKFRSTEKKKESSAQKLKKSFKKMGLDDKFYLENEEDGSDPQDQENNNRLNLQNNQTKSLAQLIYQSNRKLQEKIAQKRCQRIQDSSDQSYPITDYSSNNSSNDNDYVQEFKQSIQGTKISNSQSLTSSQSYNPMKILHSPKKSKSQSKRLYIRNKKIPKWAEDIDKVNQTAEQQKKDPNINPSLIYGCCVVEKLDTNIIFKSQERFFRGSSAKWARTPFNQFIT